MSRSGAVSGAVSGYGVYLGLKVSWLAVIWSVRPFTMQISVIGVVFHVWTQYLLFAALVLLFSWFISLRFISWLGLPFGGQYGTSVVGYDESARVCD